MKSTLTTKQDLERWRARQFFRELFTGKSLLISRWKVKGDAFAEIVKQAQELRDMVNNPALQMGMIYGHYYVEGGITDEQYDRYENFLSDNK